MSSKSNKRKANGKVKGKGNKQELNAKITKNRE